jgi:hypothetical protein
VVVIPLERERRRAKPTVVHQMSRPAPMRGTFRAPSGRWGTMSGLMRLHRLVLESGRLRAVAVFTGELLDADGSRVGVGSRRAIVPAELIRSATEILVSIGPLDVDLMGLAVSVEGFSMEMGSDVPIQGGECGQFQKSSTS